MEGGVAAGNGEGYTAKFTWTAFLCCLCASSGGALFGYDNGKYISRCAEPSCFDRFRLSGTTHLSACMQSSLSSYTEPCLAPYQALFCNVFLRLVLAKVPCYFVQTLR